MQVFKSSQYLNGLADDIPHFLAHYLSGWENSAHQLQHKSSGGIGIHQNQRESVIYL